MSVSEIIQKIKEEREMSSRYACPYCTKEVNLRFTEIEDEGLARTKLRKTKCPDCKQLIIEAGKEEMQQTYIYGGRGGTKIKFEMLPIEYEIVYPVAKKICVDDRIPEDLLDGLNEAFSTIDQSLSGAAALARATLERFIVVHLKIVTKKTLFDKIESEDMPADTDQKILHAVRMCGNYGLHAEKEAVVTKDEAFFVIRVVKNLFEDYYFKDAEKAKMIEIIREKDAKVRVKSLQS